MGLYYGPSNSGKRRRFLHFSLRLVFAVMLVFSAAPLFAQRRTVIRMASPVPENSPWGRFFNQMAADWSRITNGQVELRIFHNGVAGSEKEVVRNLRVNQLQAAVLSPLGLHEITPETITLCCPFLIRDDDELDLILAELKDDLNTKINARGYFTLAWARVGWIKFFSKTPVFVPADLKRQKLGTNSDQAEMNHIFRTMGFQMVSVESNDILIALNSNIVDAVFQSPVAVGGSQVFGLARNMASINVAPFLGVLVFNEQTWRRIPDRYKPQLLEAVRRNEAALDREVRELEEEMINLMGNHGLRVNHLTPEQAQLWFDEFERVMPSLVGTAFDRGIYERIDAILRRHRSGQQ